MMDLLLRNTGTANGYDGLAYTDLMSLQRILHYRGEFYLQEVLENWILSHGLPINGI